MKDEGWTEILDPPQLLTVSPHIALTRERRSVMF